MKFSNFKWVEYADGGYQSRGKIVSVNDLWNRLQANDWGKNPAMQDWFVSISRFDEGIRRYRDTHVNKYGNPTVEDYEGLHIIDKAVLEIDHPEGINGSIKFSNDVVSVLKNEHGIEEAELVKDVSGNKGFHFEIPAGLFMPEPHLKLFRIHKVFVESLFPEGWVKHGTMIDSNSYQINRILRLRGTRNKEFGFKVSLNGSFALLKDQPELVTDFWKAPTDECVSKEFITGEWYWQFAPKPHLAALWQKAQEQVDNEGKTRVFIPPSQRGKFSQTKIDKMPACVKAIHERMSDNVRGDGLFNDSICGLTLYYLYAGYNAEATKRMVRGLTQPLAKGNKDELEEIETSMDSMINTDGKPRYPWTCGKDAFPHLHNFCANGELKNCPSVCEHVEKVHAQITGIGQAMDSKVTQLKRGLDPYTFGISPLDNFIGFIRPGKSVIIQAVPTVGKTAFMERILKHQAGIAKSRDELVLWVPPEDDAEETAEQLMMQQGKMTIRQLSDKAKNGGFTPSFMQWFHDYNDTLKIWDVREFSVKEMETAIDAAEETFKKKVAVLYYDGVSFLKSSGTNRIAEAGVAQDIARLIKVKKTRGIFSVHPPKTADDEKNDKKAVNKRLGLYGAYGSMFFAALGRTVISLWKEDDFTLMVAAEKAKDRIDGETALLPPFRMAFDKYFNVWEQDEALAMSVSDFGQDPARSFIKRPKEFNGL